jgi:hypothetical protein
MTEAILTCLLFVVVIILVIRYYQNETKSSFDSHIGNINYAKDRKIKQPEQNNWKEYPGNIKYKENTTKSEDGNIDYDLKRIQRMNASNRNMRAMIGRLDPVNRFKKFYSEDIDDLAETGMDWWSWNNLPNGKYEKPWMAKV